MIPYKVFPMFSVGPWHINLYGIMFALGFIVATILAVKEGKKQGVDKEIIYALVSYLLVGVIIGARLFYIAFYWPEGMPITFWSVFKIWEGGLAFFGGFFGALTAGYIFVRMRKLEFWKYADIITFPLIVGHIFGRLGDYFTGGHPGKITDLPWAIYLDNALRHPVVLYEIIGLVIIGIIIYKSKKVRRVSLPRLCSALLDSAIIS